MHGYVAFGVGVMASLAMLVTAIVFAVLPKFAAIKWARILILPLVMSGVAGLAAVSIAGYSFAGVTSSATAAISRGIGSLAPAFAYAVPIIVSIVLLAIFIHDVWAVNIGRRGLVAAVGVPVTLGFIPGAIGTWAVTLVGILPLAFGTVFSALLGLR